MIVSGKGRNTIWGFDIIFMFLCKIRTNTSELVKLKRKQRTWSVMYFSDVMCQHIWNFLFQCSSLKQNSGIMYQNVSIRLKNTTISWLFKKILQNMFIITTWMLFTSELKWDCLSFYHIPHSIGSQAPEYLYLHKILYFLIVLHWKMYYLTSNKRKTAYGYLDENLIKRWHMWN